MLVLLYVKNFTSITQRTLLHGDHMTIAKALGRKLTFYALPFYLASYWYEKKLRKNVRELRGTSIKTYMKVVRRNNHETLPEIHNYGTFFMIIPTDHFHTSMKAIREFMQRNSVQTTGICQILG